MRAGTVKLSADRLNVWMGKKKILNDISFECHTGLVGLLGKNGSGKTTLIKAMLNLGCRQEGEVSVEISKESCESSKVRLSELSGRERARYLSYVPQELHSSAHCTVLDFAVTGRNPYLGWLQNPGRRDYDEARAVLEALGISFLERRYMDQISGGERKMAYLARARVQKASWMLLDEPAAGLDFGRQYQFFEDLSKCLDESRTGAIVSIHDPLLAYTYCDQLLILEDGRLEAVLSREDKDFEDKYLMQLEHLYGRRAVFADTSEGRTIIWRRT